MWLKSDAMATETGAQTDLKRAKTIAFRLLKIRQRSEKEITDRLKNKNIPPETIEQAMHYLRTYAYVDDVQFVRWWIQTRLAKPFGLKRIRSELRLKGISEELIEEELSHIAESIDETKLMDRVAQRRLGRLKGLEPLKKKRRLFDYLARRGFSPEAISRYVKKI